MASSSSSSLAPAEYDVFLSFKGEDTRSTFISHLYAALRWEKIETFVDGELARGDEIAQSISKAIKESKISAIIFSKGYTSSRCLLRELAEIMECKKKYDQIVIPVFYHVAPSDVRESANALFTKEKPEEVLEWRTALRQALSLPGFDSKTDRCESVLVEKIVKCILRELNDSRDLFIEPSTIKKIESLLCIGSKDVRTIGIWGMMGIGKTTIAKVVFDKNRYKFDNSYFAQDVHEESESPYGLTSLQQELLFKDQHCNMSFTLTKQRLSCKKILIVFDNVTSLKQIKDLIGDLNYLGVGSRVIITTRDQKVLEDCGVDESSMYEVKSLRNPEALGLFSCHAFQQTFPILAYSELSNMVVKYAKGVPIVLRVLGSFLHGKTRKVWESTIDKLKGIPCKDIQVVLRIVYDGLDDDEKNIFLDIACFLKGEDKDFIIKFLKASGFFAEIGVSALKRKSLITFSKNKITMYNLLQEIGQEIVREESSKDLRKHSRLWDHMDILQVLEYDMGTEAIEAVCLDMSKTTNIDLNFHAFTMMHSLRYLKVYNKHVEQKNNGKSHDSNHPEFVLTDELRYLCWHGYPLKSLGANFHPERLVSLDLSHSSVEQLWTGRDQNLILIHLKSINLSHSKNLIECPNFSCTPNLESLILESCTSLLEISSSITRLNKLVILNLRHCDKLQSLPGIPSESLRKVILSCCSNLKAFPDISCNTIELFLDETAIEELPPSIDNLSGLVMLNLENCSRLKSIPSNIFRLKCLEHLNLSGCSELNGLPDSVGNFEALKVLKARGAAKREIPSSIVHLCFLVELSLMDCFIVELPNDLGHLLSLECLVLARNNFESIPPSIIGLSKLSYLDLGYCQNLQSLPELPLHLQYVTAHGCTSLKGSSDLLILFPTILRRTRVNFIDCKRMDQDALRTILKNGIQKFADTITLLQESCPRPAACICFPGIEIPEWFDFQRMGSSINYFEPVLAAKPALFGPDPVFISFAVCAIVDFRNYHDEGQGLVVRCDCKLGAREGSVVLHYDIGPHNSYSDHVFLGYDLHTCSFRLGGSQYNDNYKASIQVYVEDSNAKGTDGCEVKKCGVHILSYREIRNPDNHEVRTVIPYQKKRKFPPYDKEEEASRKKFKRMPSPDFQELMEIFGGKRKRGNENNASLGLGDIMTAHLIKKTWSKALKAHNSPKKHYLVGEPNSLSNIVIFSFPGCWSANDWFTRNPFGEKKIDLERFPSLKRIATEEAATVNEAFLERFQKILPKIENEVRNVKGGKQIVFTGHSSGGPTAILVTVWFLQEQLKKPNPENRLSPLCITFGSPLVGDRIFNHALSREKWSQYFTHFVMRYDIIPRVLLSPLSSIEQELISILHYLKPKSTFLKQEPCREASTLYKTVMRHVSSLASHAACQLMGNTHDFSETLSKFIELSPYRPFGTYIFCSGNEELVVVENPDAVLQILLYSFQLSSAQEVSEIAMRSIKSHHIYQKELESIEKEKVFRLDLERLQSSSDVTIDMVLNNLGLSTEARLCLCAAREYEKQKLENQKKFDAQKMAIKTRLDWLERYKARCESRKISYYDAFKISRNIDDDFKANVKRLELAGIFDELMEMIKTNELPDGFESNREWIDIGTRNRRLVEPLDIANYYRHGRNFGSKSKPYMKYGRPKRYRFSQKWHEYARGIESEPISESCFWAEVEELDVSLKDSTEGLSNEVKERISRLEKNVGTWVSRGELGLDIFFEDSTFVKWWKTVPQQNRSGSCLLKFINK